jgi:hypothetical protein
VAKPRIRPDRNLVYELLLPSGTYVQSFGSIAPAVTKRALLTDDERRRRMPRDCTCCIGSPQVSQKWLLCLAILRWIFSIPEQQVVIITKWSYKQGSNIWGKETLNLTLPWQPKGNFSTLGWPGKCPKMSELSSISNSFHGNQRLHIWGLLKKDESCKGHSTLNWHKMVCIFQWSPRGFRSA